MTSVKLTFACKLFLTRKYFLWDFRPLRRSGTILMITELGHLADGLAPLLRLNAFRLIRWRLAQTIQKAWTLYYYQCFKAISSIVILHRRLIGFKDIRNY